MKRLCIFLLVLLSLIACKNDDFKKGVEAYEKEDFATAKLFYEKSCDDGYIEGCNNLGELYYYGKGIEQNYTKAGKIFQKTCEKKSGHGCRFVGIFYYHGYGDIEESDEKAAEYRKKSCDYKDAIGCLNTGNSYRFGTGVRKDLQIALDYVKKSCEMKLEVACNSRKDIEEEILVENAFKDGSHYAVVDKIKSYMKAPDSYKHVKTSYDFNRMGNIIHLETIFNGKNSYNGYSQYTVKATVDLDGNILWFDLGGKGALLFM
ncbi:MAG: sel1 repeat family protein [Campylobacteraceae bacterium]|jgi:TPR repeat protein|nr:sel1 repeat family protein [Campylobacteraceae bacterium]